MSGRRAKGAAHASLGALDQAGIAWRRAVEVDPSDADAWSNLRVLARRMGDAEAFRQADAALRAIESTAAK